MHPLVENDPVSSVLGIGIEGRGGKLPTCRTDQIDHDLDQTDQADQIDHDLDHRDPNLQL